MTDSQQAPRMFAWEDRVELAGLRQSFLKAAFAQVQQAPSPCLLAASPYAVQQFEVRLAAAADVGPRLPGVAGWTVNGVVGETIEWWDIHLQHYASCK
jgi:hypothetical protein